MESSAGLIIERSLSGQRQKRENRKIRTSLGFTRVKLIGYNSVNSIRIETLFSTKLPQIPCTINVDALFGSSGKPLRAIESHSH